ncbi:MAG: hypothetical protein ABH821_00590 [archaeon]
MALTTIGKELLATENIRVQYGATKVALTTIGKELLATENIRVRCGATKVALTALQKTPKRFGGDRALLSAGQTISRQNFYQ